MTDTAAPFHRDELEHTPNAHIFHGHEHGDVGVSFFMVHYQPGYGPFLHVHPYGEVFIVEAGEARFTVGDNEVTAREKELLVVPPNTPHAFVNSGSGELRLTAIHPAARMETEWLEESG
jgi:mannose-6-phosphate isomerase-like protein (cupin superfamily)